jgi:hypothetical protein
VIPFSEGRSKNGYQNKDVVPFLERGKKKGSNKLFMTISNHFLQIFGLEQALERLPRQLFNILQQ